MKLLAALQNFDKDFAKETIGRVLENIVRGDSSKRKPKRR